MELCHLCAGVYLFAGTVIAILATTIGEDPLSGIIVFGGSLLLARVIVPQGEMKII